jgi:uncharacterized protein (DUF488 family)
MKTHGLFTIGYEGRTIDEFIDRLKQFHISRLIDVREIPLSRKKGFSKSALRERLQNENIEYVHIKALGTPSSIRNKLKSDWNYDNFFKAYAKHLSHNLESAQEAYEYIYDGNNCIMCFELTPEKCHRIAIANKMKELGGNKIKISHI